MTTTAQKMKFSIKYFFTKCDQICRRLRIWPYLLKEFLIENLIFAQCTLGNQISKNVFDTMNISDNPKIDKKKGIKRRSHSSRAKASKEDEEDSRRKRQKLRDNVYRESPTCKKKR